VTGSSYQATTPAQFDTEDGSDWIGGKPFQNCLQS